MDRVDGFNALPAEQATVDLLACCSVPEWAARVVAGRPYHDRATVLAAADAAARALTWADVELGLAGHPRIGERAAGGGRAATWSRREQAGAATADDVTRTALVQANRAYEQRFGHVFLIFASGRTDAELLAAARQRVRNDETTERAVVADELRRIALLRLERLLDERG